MGVPGYLGTLGASQKPSSKVPPTACYAYLLLLRPTTKVPSRYVLLFRSTRGFHSLQPPTAEARANEAGAFQGSGIGWDTSPPSHGQPPFPRHAPLAPRGYTLGSAFVTGMCVILSSHTFAAVLTPRFRFTTRSNHPLTYNCDTRSCTDPLRARCEYLLALGQRSWAIKIEHTKEQQQYIISAKLPVSLPILFFPS